MLPVWECLGRLWFVDEWVGEFRETCNPDRYVKFSSEKGKAMRLAYVLRGRGVFKGVRPGTERAG